MILDSFPRALGFPRQAIIKDKASARNLIRQHSGMAPVYASHNAYTTLDASGTPMGVNYEWMPHDFDAEDITGPLEDARALATLIDSLDQPLIMRFSGCHGFHVYNRFIPTDLPITPASAMKVTAVQNWLLSRAGTLTHDSNVIGDLRRLMRVPRTPWAKEKGSQVFVNGLHCITLSLDELMTLTAKDILEIAKDPRRTPTEAIPAPATHTLDGFIGEHAIDVEHHVRNENNTTPTAFLAYQEVNEELLSQLLQRPCVVSDLCSSSPKHVSRFYAVTRLNAIGLPQHWIEGLIVDLASRYGWEGFDYSTTSYQVDNLISRGYKHPTCSTIRAKGGCMGSACPNFGGSCAS